MSLSCKTVYKRSFKVIIQMNQAADFAFVKVSMYGTLENESFTCEIGP